MHNKPALLSGRDSESLGLIKIKAEEVFAMSTMVNDIANSTQENLPVFRLNDGPEQANTMQHP
jgi:hypothetical protein